ncbi:MAG TPA: acyl carrier protein [Ignavibacteria bacterium]
METKILEIINYIRINKKLEALSEIHPSDNLRNQIGFTSFDLAELTVRIEDEFDIDIFEDGLVSTIGDIFEKLK